MTKKLFLQAVIKYLAGVVLLGALIFLPAGGLPGKYLPESAAAVLYEAIQRHWEVEP